MVEKWEPDRTKFKDSQGRFITQSLFLEHGYNTEFSMYTLTDEDKTYNGKVYPSLRRIYLETMDPTEYEFATTYLWGWEHWQRLLANKAIREEIDKWREELEVKLRAKAIKSILNLSEGKFEAAKWAADGHWNTKRGRPSKDELAREKRIRERAAEEATEDASRIIDFIPRMKKDA